MITFFCKQDDFGNYIVVSKFYNVAMENKEDKIISFYFKNEKDFTLEGDKLYPKSSLTFTEAKKYIKDRFA